MADLAALVARLEAATVRLEGLSGVVPKPAAGATVASADEGAVAEKYDESVGMLVTELANVGAGLGGDAQMATVALVDAFAVHRAFIIMASNSKMPADNGASLVPGLVEKIGAVNAVLDANPRTKDYEFLKALGEAAGTIGWVLQRPKPVPFINDQTDSATFWTNKILKAFKDSDKVRADWARKLIALLKGLSDYVKKTHTTGLTWNPNGVEAKAPAAAAIKTTTPTKAPAPKPPVAKKSVTSGNAPAGRGGLFAAISKGSSVTSGLKKVDRSQMTHKNKDLRASSVVKSTALGNKGKEFSTGVATKKDPVFELSGNGKKWLIEHQVDNKTLVVEPELSQTVYIYKCTGSTIQVKGKCNSICLDGCKKTAVVFTSLLSSVDVINCQSMQVQVTGKVPIINVDKTDGMQIFLSKESQGAQIVSAKSSEMNVSIPPEKEDDDWTETPLPEQYLSVWNPKTKQFDTTTIKHE